jgi:anti-sigma regulatory factor (Ser/Thr protein kinase)
MLDADVLNHQAFSLSGRDTYTADVRSSSQARRIAHGFLSVLSPQPSSETADTVLLVVSELVTNAFQHGGGVSDFALSASHSTVHVTVADTNSALPQERAPDLRGDGETGGFGWPLVRHFASEVHIALAQNHGKSLRVSLPV